MTVFVLTGAVFAFFNERFTRALTAEGARNQLEADLRELTSLHERLKQLDNERRIFVAFIENSPDFIGIADVSGKPVYVNRLVAVLTVVSCRPERCPTCSSVFGRPRTRVAEAPASAYPS